MAATEDIFTLVTIKKKERAISRILFLPFQEAMIISLGCRSPDTSCNLPEDL